MIIHSSIFILCTGCWIALCSLSGSEGNLEGQVKWLDNYQQVKQLREALVWLPVWERDKRAFVPEVRT